MADGIEHFRIFGWVWHIVLKWIVRLWLVAAIMSQCNAEVALALAGPRDRWRAADGTMILHAHLLGVSCIKVRLRTALIGRRLDLPVVDVHPDRQHRSVAFRALNPAVTLLVPQDHWCFRSGWANPMALNIGST